MSSLCLLIGVDMLRRQGFLALSSFLWKPELVNASISPLDGKRIVLICGGGTRSAKPESASTMGSRAIVDSAI